MFYLFESMYDSNFIHRIAFEGTVDSDLQVFMYHPEMMDVIRSPLSNSLLDLPTVEVSYDTIFNLRDIFLSILLFRETDFESKPVIPLAFFLHERKTTMTHDEFFRYIR